MPGPTIGSTQLNPASPGGPAVAVDTSSVPGQLVPVSDLMVDGAAVSAAASVALPSALYVSPDGFAPTTAVTGSTRGTPGTPLPVADANSASLQSSIDELNFNMRALVRGLSMILDVDLIELVSQ